MPSGSKKGKERELARAFRRRRLAKTENVRHVARLARCAAFDSRPIPGYNLGVIDRAWILTLGHLALANRHSELR